ncbi:MAG: hypothetical protein WBO10_03515 [Pyrinomonadaceae bacterium]
MSNNSGKLTSVHVIESASVQRAVFVTVLAFAFFLAMMVVYYLRQNLVFFVLASAFLVVYLAMMFSLIMLRRSAVEVYENGINLRKRYTAWGDIVAISEDGVVSVNGGKDITLPSALIERKRLIEFIGSKISRSIGQQL